MRVGRLFTFQGHRYEPGDDFDIGVLPVYRRPTFVRQFGLSEQPPAARRKKMRAAEPDESESDSDFLAELVGPALTESMDDE